MEKNEIQILLVEDEPIIQDSIKVILSHYNYDVETADNGLDALEMINSKKFDLIICDVMMPKLNGFGLLSELQKSNVEIPFIFLTAKVQYDDFREGMNLGADDYLYKPFKAEDLLKCVKNRLDKYINSKQKINTLIDGFDKTIQLMIGHEFYTPINGIVSFANLIREKAITLKDEELLEFTKYLEISSNRLVKTFSKVKDYYEINSDEHFKLFQVSGISTTSFFVEEAQAIAIAHNRSKDLFIDLSNIDSIPIKKGICSNIFCELIDNAFKFSLKGTKVKIWAEQSKDQLSIFLSDQGNLVDAMKLEEHLGSIGQLNRSKLEQQGLGFGLAIAFLWIKNIGASIKISDNQPDGILIKVSLKIVHD